MCGFAAAFKNKGVCDGPSTDELEDELDELDVEVELEVDKLDDDRDVDVLDEDDLDVEVLEDIDVLEDDLDVEVLDEDRELDVLEEEATKHESWSIHAWLRWEPVNGLYFV